MSKRPQHHRAAVGIEGVTPGTTDREAFATRLEAALGPLQSYVKLLVSGGGPADPDDIVQETLKRAWIHRAGHQADRPLLPWLRRIALHLLLDQRAGRSEAPLPAEPRQAASSDSPLDALARHEEVERLLARLPAREAQLLDRFHRRGESVREISLDLALPEGTVRSLLHRARRHLAEGGRHA